MAKLFLDDVDCGLHAFVIPLRSPETHLPYPSKFNINFFYILLLFLADKDIEIGDIGFKSGFNSMDNGFLGFKNYRFPRFNMLMNFAQVSREGKFTRTGSELLMYASMLGKNNVIKYFLYFSPRINF
jgi:acyl-CoA oxidase